MVATDLIRPLQKHIYDMDLQGCHVIEASAGTGKTYSIQTLYLRLVLEYGLSVDAIVVMTFTEKATGELRGRLRAILEKSRRFLQNMLPENDGDYERINAVMQRQLRNPLPIISEAENRQRRLESAIQNFDQAAIYTIHSFCARTLQESAFETGVLFDIELIGNSDQLLRDVVNDWFRHLASRTEFESIILANQKLDRKFFMEVAKCCIEKPDACIELAPPEGNYDLSSISELLAQTFDHEDIQLCLAADSSISRSAKNYKEEKVHAALDCIQDFLQGCVQPGIADAIYLFTPERLQQGLKGKATSIPEHPFFKSCENAWARITSYTQHTKREFLEVVTGRYARSKRERQVRTYNDLILEVRSALRNPQVGPRLKQRLDQMYAAALIDEFQDTDPLQYEIFKTIFIESDQGKPVFLVGDPKQAIYSFRSGDVYTYYDAVRGKSCFRLDRNYRSEKGLVTGVNQLFADTDERRGFLTDGIRYDGQLKANGRDLDESLLQCGKIDNRPLKIFFTPEDGAWLNKTSILDDIAQLAAAEVQQLLITPELTLKNRAIKPSDIAILVTEHEQARAVYPYLKALQIPVVLQSTGNIFDSEEAAEMQLVMAALADPVNRTAVRSALATDFFNCNGRQILDFMLFEHSADLAAEDPLDHYVALFTEAHMLWRDRSFVEGVNSVFDSANLREHVLRMSGGERKLTNILHLVELMHEASQKLKLGMNGLQQWLTKQMDWETRDERDEFELRLESDSEAVQIMTVYSSKGLQFPIVLVPFMWTSRAGRNSRVYQYHVKTNKGHRLHIDLDCNEVNQPAHNEERLAELVRLLYVGLTRAANRVYLTWGNITSTADTAPNWVLHAGKAEKSHCRLTDLKEWCTQPGLQTLELPKYDGDKPYPGDEKFLRNCSLQARTWPETRSIDRSWHIASFTSLHPEYNGDPLKSDPKDLDAEDKESQVDEALSSESTIMDFPAGEKTGNCWHTIFEKIDFTADREVIDTEVVRQLQQFHMLLELPDDRAEVRERQVAEMVQNVLNVPLADNIRLCDVPLQNRLTELEFHFPLKNQKKTTEAIYHILYDHWQSDDSKKDFLHVLRNWKRSLPTGMFTGKIDLIFRVPDVMSRLPEPGRYRYFLVDWKSNKLNGRSESFWPEGLIKEMARHAYFLQYLFYSVALHQFLKAQLNTEYSYDSCFGGVYYIFLRGVDCTSGRGLFCDRPSAALINDLSELLGDFRNED